MKTEKVKSHQLLCKGKPTMLKNEYNEETGIFSLTCIKCNKVIYKCEFKAEGMK